MPHVVMRFKKYEGALKYFSFFSLVFKIHATETRSACYEHIFAIARCYTANPHLIPQNNTCRIDNYSFSELACLFEG